MELFNIEIAGVPVNIRCSHESNHLFFNDYISEKRSLFSIEPGPDDLKHIQTLFCHMDEENRLSRHDMNPVFLENIALQYLLAESLLEYNVLLMHGSALCMDGEAYVFTAPSGTGKSTYARLWREVFGERVWMINDDKPFLKVSDDGVIVYGSPWAGKHRLHSNACAPLKAIVLLERDGNNHITPIPKAEAFPVILKQCYRSSTPAKMTSIIQLEKNILNKVELYRLGCNIEPEAAKTAWEGMNYR